MGNAKRYDGMDGWAHGWMDVDEEQQEGVGQERKKKTECFRPVGRKRGRRGGGVLFLFYIHAYTHEAVLI